jgi:hypothetical protein
MHIAGFAGTRMAGQPFSDQCCRARPGEEFVGCKACHSRTSLTAMCQLNLQRERSDAASAVGCRACGAGSCGQVQAVPQCVALYCCTSRLCSGWAPGLGCAAAPGSSCDRHTRPGGTPMLCQSGASGPVLSSECNKPATLSSLFHIVHALMRQGLKQAAFSEPCVHLQKLAFCCCGCRLAYQCGRATHAHTCSLRHTRDIIAAGRQ